MLDPLAWLDGEAQRRDGLNLNRTLRRFDPSLINFASNDYLGLAADPRLKEAARLAAERFGWGAGASPLLTGWTEAHEDLADALARFEGTESALLFPSGYAANLGTVGSMVGPGDAVYLDRLNHACLIDGAKLSGASLRIYPHGDSERLASILSRDRLRYRRSLIATDGVFSMDGDLAPIDRLVEIAEAAGAMLLVDEAHGTGVFGPDGRGAASELGVADRVAIRVGTLSKALGSLGGFVSGSRKLIDRIVNSARPFVFSTSLPAPVAAAAREALRIVETEPWRRVRVRQTARHLADSLQVFGFSVPVVTGPIVPVLLGEPEPTLRVAALLRNEGFVVGAIRPPTVPRGTARLRISLSASHSDDDVARLLDAFRKIG